MHSGTTSEHTSLPPATTWFLVFDSMPNPCSNYTFHFKTSFYTEHVRKFTFHHRSRKTVEVVADVGVPELLLPDTGLPEDPDYPQCKSPSTGVWHLDAVGQGTWSPEARSITFLELRVIWLGIWITALSEGCPSLLRHCCLWRPIIWQTRDLLGMLCHSLWWLLLSKDLWGDGGCFLCRVWFSTSNWSSYSSLPESLAGTTAGPGFFVVFCQQAANLLLGFRIRLVEPESKV